MSCEQSYELVCRTKTSLRLFFQLGKRTGEENEWWVWKCKETSTLDTNWQDHLGGLGVSEGDLPHPTIETGTAAAEDSGDHRKPNQTTVIAIKIFKTFLCYQSLFIIHNHHISLSYSYSDLKIATETVHHAGVVCHIIYRVVWERSISYMYAWLSFLDGVS